MGLFDNIIDDTTEVTIEVFGELVILLRETNIQEYEIIRYALKHSSLPDQMEYDDYKDEIYPSPAHIFFTDRANRYIPKVEKWCRDNKSKIINLNIIKEGKYPEKYDYIDIPDRPEFKLNFIDFLVKNWQVLLHFYFGVITAFTIVGAKFGYKNAYVALNRLLAVYEFRSKTAVIYLIATIPIAVYCGFAIVLMKNLL